MVDTQAGVVNRLVDDVDELRHQVFDLTERVDALMAAIRRIGASDDQS